MKQGTKLVALSIFCFLFCVFFIAVADAYSSPGQPSGYINDFAEIISDNNEELLERTLAGFENSSTNEIAVATISSLEDETIETYAVKLFEEWGIGRQKEDNGVLLLIAPNERKVRIEVGYGLEGALTDLESSQIIRNILTPAFRENDFDNGIKQAVAAIMQATKGEYGTAAASSGAVKKTKRSFEGLLYLVFVIIFIIVELIAATVRNASKSHAIWPGGLAGGVIGAIIGFLLVGGLIVVGFIIGGGILGLGADYLLSRHPVISRWGKKVGKNRGRGGFWWFLGGGGRGGGFGGFGGGLSGGGGASGDW